jgi:hypothetical protein
MRLIMKSVDVVNTFVILLLIFSGCYCGSNSNGGIRDAGIKDVVNICGVGRYPSFDYQCYKVEGCREINKGSCGCRCTRCEYERCVEISCNGGCIVDGGRELEEIRDVEEEFDIEDEDVRDVVDEKIKDVIVEDVFDVEEVGDVMDVGDADNYEYVCKDPGDPEGVEFSGNLDEPIVLISNRVYMDAYVTGEYVVWQEVNNRETFAENIYYLSLKDRRVRRVPNCDGYDYIESLQIYGSKIYWANSGNVCAGGKPCDVIWEFDLEKKNSPRVVSIKDAALFPKVYKDSLVYTIIVNDTSKKNGTYFTELSTNKTQKISDKYDILSDYSTALWENLIVATNTSGEIYSYNIDTFEKKIHYQSNIPIFASVFFSPVIPILQFIDETKYGHYTTDVYLLNIEKNDELIKVTEDEEYQWRPIRCGDYVVIYHENYDKHSSELGYGYLVVYDIERRIRRVVPNSDGIDFPIWCDGGRLLYTDTYGSRVFPIYMRDLEKLGVIKDGHVVPE